MFEQSMLNRKSGGRRPLALVLSLCIQVGLLLIALVIPLVFADVLPAAQLSTLFVLPTLPVAAKAAEASPETATSAKRVKVKPVATNTFTAPSEIPKKVANIVEIVEVDPNLMALASATSAGARGGRYAGPPIPGLENFERGAATPPPPPPVVPQPKKEVIRIKRGGEVVAAQAISRPSPAYPELAKRARVEGDVHLNAIIGVDGHIKELRVQSGHPLLVQAAMEAVRQWSYSPTVLNGDPVEVITQITVTFRLR